MRLSNFLSPSKQDCHTFDKGGKTNQIEDGKMKILLALHTRLGLLLLFCWNDWSRHSLWVIRESQNKNKRLTDHVGDDIDEMHVRSTYASSTICFGLRWDDFLTTEKLYRELLSWSMTSTCAHMLQHCTILIIVRVLQKIELHLVNFSAVLVSGKNRLDFHFIPVYDYDVVLQTQYQVCRRFNCVQIEKNNTSKSQNEWWESSESCQSFHHKSFQL